MSDRTSAGFVRFRRVCPGARIALVAPASPFEQSQFDAGVAELKRLGFEAVYDESVFDRLPLTAGSAGTRALALMRAFERPDADAVMAVRGGYGSVETLPLLDADRIKRSRRAFIGYSDLTTMHAYLGTTAGMASVHGSMLEGRFGQGPTEYDSSSFLTSLTDRPLGELSPAGLETVNAGDASGPICGGTLVQLLASFGTPYEFRPPDGHVLFLEDVGERPYRVHRMLTQWRLAGRFRSTVGIVFAQFPKCEEPGGGVTVLDVIREFAADFPGPVVFGFPSGHTTTPTISMPFGVRVRVVAGPAPAVVFEEAAASS
jgi:muramoyltetrapeptide carboxypeptidase